MNCQAGDLAVVVQCECDRWLIGRIVRVTQLMRSSLDARPDVPQWELFEPIPVPGKPDLRYIALYDDLLKPIRDPGDDAVDEMVKRVGKPRTVRTGLPQVALDRLSHNRAQWP